MSSFPLGNRKKEQTNSRREASTDAAMKSRKLQAAKALVEKPRNANRKRKRVLPGSRESALFVSPPKLDAVTSRSQRPSECNTGSEAPETTRDSSHSSSSSFQEDHSVSMHISTRKDKDGVSQARRPTLTYADKGVSPIRGSLYYGGPTHYAQAYNCFSNQAEIPTYSSGYTQSYGPTYLDSLLPAPYHIVDHTEEANLDYCNATDAQRNQFSPGQMQPQEERITTAPQVFFATQFQPGYAYTAVDCARASPYFTRSVRSPSPDPRPLAEPTAEMKAFWRPNFLI